MIGTREARAENRAKINRTHALRSCAAHSPIQSTQTGKFNVFPALYEVINSTVYIETGIDRKTLWSDFL